VIDTTMTQPKSQPAAAAVDPHRWRQDFPALRQDVQGHPLVYLDNAATTQKPRCVIEAVQSFYERDNANVHRGVHALSVRATEHYEGARAAIQRLLNAADRREIVFVRGATEAVNLVAQSFGRPRLRSGDEILITTMEHHSNIVPWQLLCEQTGAVLRVAPIDDRGDVILEEYEKLLSPRTRIAAFVHVSNALGTVNPVADMVRLARRNGTVVLIDGAQAVPHLSVDVRSLDCDFYVFSGHKMFGPTGIGVLWGRSELLDEMPPYQGGGEMIRSVTFEKTTYARPPARFEAGTPNIAGAIGLGAAAAYLDRVGREAIAAHEQNLLAYATERLQGIAGLRIIGTARHKAAVLSFVLDNIHPHDVGTVVDELGVAIRTGHHCAQPVMQRFTVPATCRASLAFYNTKEEIDALVQALRRVREVLG
jgi:cysteine desulfurase/selenocysteine lyase